MPSAGFVTGTTVRSAGVDGHGFSTGPEPPGPLLVGSGAARLSHATIAFTRGSVCPVSLTAVAPSE